MRKILLTTAILGSIIGASVLLARNDPAAAAVAVPPAAIDQSLAKQPGTETAILSGGCFWGMQAVFQHVKGVREVLAGYTGGAADTADYETVSTGTTGHAESVKVVFDPSIISYGTLLRIYFSVATNPTELNYQDPDRGTQYRGEIWVGTPGERLVAEAYINQLTAEHVFPARIVTRIDPAMPFYPAENYHQNYATLNPDSLYIATYDLPKVTELARLFPTIYNARPLLVPAGAS